MHVQQVEIVDFRHLGHPRGQRKIIGRILEQRITRNLDLVIVNVGMRFGEPDRLRVGNEVNLVSSLGQFDSQLGRDDSASAVSWITGDSYAHGFSIIGCMLT